MRPKSEVCLAIITHERSPMPMHRSVDLVLVEFDGYWIGAIEMSLVRDVHATDSPSA